ncbi:hemolymph lipopolysaccharide-binding protein [Anabrus simplex]|uniref:hemolymph lipopolysaccharide-binding protein n=1 Tax=Anabrus simplex TaxID=316456 RepID=UPI0035A37738
MKIICVLLLLLVDTRRFASAENQRDVNDNSEREQLDSETSVDPPSHGYQLFADFNWYKWYGRRESWSDAREQCKRDGGDLMVAESEEERKKVFLEIYQSLEYLYSLWMGVNMSGGEDSWVSVKGEPALSTWWKPGYPIKRTDLKCAAADSSGELFNKKCTGRLPFICEIPQ